MTLCVSPPLRAVVFDLDGVLIDSIAVMREAFQRAYAEVVGTADAPFEEYLHHLGRHMPDTLRIMGLPAAMYELFVRESHDLAHLIPPCQGAAWLLDELAAGGAQLAVATGKSRARAEHNLEAVGLRRRLAVVTGSDEVERGKPAPDIVELTLERLGVRAAEAIAVGDSPLDLEAGRAAGTRVAAALWGQGDHAALLACQPDVVAASCEELGRAVGGLLAVPSRG